MTIKNDTWKAKGGPFIMAKTLYFHLSDFGVFLELLLERSIE